ncbi:MAG: lipopolysaccharide biosynthesis protein [Oscillochloridaceae bacterium umkhey_bin13]
MLTFHEIWNYLRILLRWWWVLLIATTLAAGVAALLVARQPQYYIARTTLMVGDTLNSPTPDAQLMGISSALTGFYAEIAKREPILGPVTERLGLTFPWQVINTYMLTTSVNRQASLIELTITDTNPERAAAIVTAIAEELVRYSPNSPEKVAEQRLLINEQLTQAQTSLESIERSIDETRALQSQVVGAADLREVRSRLEELERTRQSTQDTYNQLVRLQNSSVVNSLNVVEPARIPTSPLPSKGRLTIALAAGGGLLLAMIAVFVLELVDDRWRSASDLRSRLGLTTLGLVPGRKPLYQLPNESARLRELAVREAHAQIVLAGSTQNKQTILVTSVHSSKARSALAVDLAQLFTRSGYRVLLVDADTEVSHLTELIGTTGEAPKPVVMINGVAEIWSNLQATPLKHVMLLAHNQGSDGRPLPPSLPWPALVESLSRAADIIIFDGPSALSGIDAALLAPLVDGVILTVDPQQDRRNDVAQSSYRLSRTGGERLLGAVMLIEEITTKPSSQQPWLPLPLRQALLGSANGKHADDDMLELPKTQANRVIVTPTTPSLNPAESTAEPGATDGTVMVLDQADADYHDAQENAEAGSISEGQPVRGEPQ